MKYLLAIYGNDDVWNSFPPEQLQQIIKETDAHNTSLFASGELIGAYGVADQIQAKKVRLADGAAVVTDGPFVEGKEEVGGYLIVSANDLNEAVALAKGCPIFENNGTVEVRPIEHIPGL